MSSEFAQVLDHIIEMEFGGNGEDLRRQSGIGNAGAISYLRQGKRITTENLRKLAAVVSEESRFSLLTAAAREFLPDEWAPEVLRARGSANLAPEVEQSLSLLEDMARLDDEVGEVLVQLKRLFMIGE